MQLDTDTATAIMKSAEQANAIANEATRRVVELMQEAIEDRERIAELEAAINRAGALALQKSSHELIREALADVMSDDAMPVIAREAMTDFNAVR